MGAMGVNLISILVAAIAAMAFGAAYYGDLGKQWMASSGVTEEQVKDGGAMPFAIAFICELVMAYMLAVILVHFASDGAVSLGGALATSFYLWLGIVMTTQIINHRYGLRPWSLTLIDGGHWLGVLLIQGAVLALIGPA